ncbi:hypothetical protein DL768_002865 [Monosporascus sp. mg162]|nr:hypothetical protein DL768_002865 [Monosporascus sp. mg162]
MVVISLTAWVLLLAAGRLGRAGRRQSQDPQVAACSLEYFSTIVPQHIVVERVQNVTTGFFVEPGNLGYPSFASGLPPVCAVIIQNMTANYRFGMFLPDSWNSKLLVVGNYGFLGGINWLDMGPGPKFGLASLSTDTGHNSGQADQSWADTEQRKINWAYQALEGSTILGKRLIQTYYDNRPLTYTYFSGCSTGGRQGLKQIQRDPDIFDGALIGAPAWDTENLMPWVSKLAVWNLPEDASYAINDPSLFIRLQTEVLKQCDHLDGLRDDIVSSPGLCRQTFNITKLRCDVTSNQTSCWTQPQIETAQKMYDDYTTEDGTFVHKGQEYGSEAEWGTYLLPIGPGPGNVRRNFDAQYERYFMDYGPDWQITSYNDSVVGDSRRRDRRSVSATSGQYDLGRFRDRGKIIMYSGLADGVVPVRHTTLYYDRTVERMGGVDCFFRYFQVPGMGHCWGTPNGVKAPWMIGGAGQAAQRPPYNAGWSVPLGFNDSRHDALLALMNWVENGNAPYELVASEFNFTDATRQNIVVHRQRPICMYPRVAVWDERGSRDDASSWGCG